MSISIHSSTQRRGRLRLAAAGVFAVAIAWCVWQLRPPPAFEVPPHWPALVGVTVINPGGERLPNRTVVLQGDRIEAVRERRAEDGDRLRLRLFEHRYVLPGLIDLRVQQPPAFTRLSDLFGLLYLASGVTTVRDTGNFAGDLPATQQAIKDGKLAWPRLLACGRVLEGDPPTCAGSRVVRDAANAAAAVDEVVRGGAQCVRVHRSVRADVRAAISAVAAARGLPIVGDLPTPEASGEASIFATINSEPAAPLASIVAGWRTLAEDDLAAIADRLPRGTYVSPLVSWNMLADPAAIAADGGAIFLPRFLRTIIWPAQARRAVAPLSSADADPTLVRDVAAKMIRLGDRLRRHGSRVCMASGTPGLYAAPGWSMLYELHLFTAGGLSLVDAWRTATRDAGELLGIAQLGTIAAGAPADLLIFREDPMLAPDAWMTLEAVVSQGRLYPREFLLRAMLEQARSFERPLYDLLATAATRLMLWWDENAVVDCQLP